MPQAIPFILAAGAATVQSVQADQSGQYNSSVLQRQARIVQAQGYQDEAAQRRQANQVLGVQEASFSEAGGGLGGTAAGVVRQSAVNAELDALQLRYNGLLRGSGLLAQSNQAKEEASASSIAGAFQAGSNLLKGYSAQSDASDLARRRANGTA